MIPELEVVDYNENPNNDVQMVMVEIERSSKCQSDKRAYASKMDKMFYLEEEEEG